MSESKREKLKRVVIHQDTRPDNLKSISGLYTGFRHKMGCRRSRAILEFVSVEILHPKSIRFQGECLDF